MKDGKYIVFDFDGTIADTIDLALTVYNRIAPEYNCKPLTIKDRKILSSGRPQDLLKSYGVTNLKLVSIILRIRKEMSSVISELKPVKDIFDTIKEIKNSGLRLGILTSNSKSNVSLFLENNGFADMFDFIYSGKSLFGKDLVIKRMLDHERIPQENVIYIGDETRDIEASRRTGIPVIAVTWGLSDKQILASSQPDQIADNPKDLLPCVKQILNEQFT